MTVEQGSVIGWDRYAGASGEIIGMHTFGSSAPLKDLLTKFGFAADKVLKCCPTPDRTEQEIMNPVKKLQSHGQAVWLDFLARGFIAKGDLKTLIERDGVRGSPQILRFSKKAIAGSDEYDDAISALLKQHDRPVGDLYEALAVEDIQHATPTF